MKTLAPGFLLMCGLVAAFDARAAASADVTGRWEVTTTYPGGSYVAGLNVTQEEDKYKAKSGWLVPD